LIGFDTFKASKRAARTGKNPRADETLKIAASTVPTFQAGAASKAAMKKRSDLMNRGSNPLRFHHTQGLGKSQEGKAS